MADQLQDSTASIIFGFIVVMAATVAVLMASGTIPGHR
jgi:hypothetical protein